MGKKNKKRDCVLSDDVIKSLSKKDKNILRQKLEELTVEARIDCAHTKKNGNPALLIYDNHQCDCEICGTKFNLGQISKKELMQALRVLSNAGNQLKVFSSNSAEDKPYIVQLGTTIENMRNMVNAYERLVIEGAGNKKKKKNKNKNRNNNNNYNGGYGSNSLKLNR